MFCTGYMNKYHQGIRIFYREGNVYGYFFYIESII